MPDLRPGNLTGDVDDFGEFFGSMAHAIEEELDDLLDLDGLPQLPKTATDAEVRARRRFIIAIARGVVRHLVENSDAFVVTQTGSSFEVSIQSEQL